MKYLDEFRSADLVQNLLRAIRSAVTRPWTIMEICGGQTHSILRFGLDELLPREITLVHGPGCPVCVTPVELLDAAGRLARMPGVVLCTFGDMLRVPGTLGDLFQARAEGGDVRIVQAPSDAVRMAQRNPDRHVVWFAVGFETTAPATALAVKQARMLGLENFSVLLAHVRVPPAVEAILSSPSNRVQGFLAAGHVCTVMGTAEYEQLARRFRVPIVVTGFEPCDILEGVLHCVRQLEAGRHEVENVYNRVVRSEGNRQAQALMAEVFRPVDLTWRGIGSLPGGGLAFTAEYERFDALRRFDGACDDLARTPLPEGNGANREGECIAALVLQGIRKPNDCPAFAVRCTPETPLGAPMVSSEGACAAYYRYRHGQAASLTVTSP
ncbi:MAG: hydrogenase formation protein HypD [Gemmatales bacterium]|nr:hydrogenase formation protein HypD [Gemmatales bacterium]MDW8386366.1 hydrogenase formation protein HypD [Gemmatales bacterium]